MPRGAPSMIFSSESVKSAISTCVVAAPRGQQRRLVGEVGEVGADHPRRASRRARRGRRSAASGMPCVCTARIAARPARSGGCTATRRSKRPGRSSAGSSTSGRLVAASTTTASVGSKPSISVRIWSSVCSRSSLAPVTDDRALARAADRVELVDEDDRRRRRSRLREQVAHARGADADDRLDELRRRDREERGVRLAGDRAREQRLAGAGRARQQHAVRHPAAEAPVALRVLQEVDDLGQLGLRLVDAGDVGEGDADRLRVDAARLRAAEAAERAHPAAAAAAAPREQHERARRSAASGRSRAGARPAATSSPSSTAALISTSFAAQQRLELAAVPERRHLRREQRRRRRRLRARAGSRPCVLKVPWIASPFVVIELDLAGLDLGREVRAERDRHARLRRRAAKNSTESQLIASSATMK